MIRYAQQRIGKLDANTYRVTLVLALCTLQDLLPGAIEGSWNQVGRSQQLKALDCNP